jgi:hypothetical protein
MQDSRLCPIFFAASSKKASSSPRLISPFRRFVSTPAGGANALAMTSKGVPCTFSGKFLLFPEAARHINISAATPSAIPENEQAATRGSCPAAAALHALPLLISLDVDKSFSPKKTRKVVAVARDVACNIEKKKNHVHCSSTVVVPV